MVHKSHILVKQRGDRETSSLRQQSYSWGLSEVPEGSGGEGQGEGDSHILYLTIGHNTSPNIVL